MGSLVEQKLKSIVCSIYVYCTADNTFANFSENSDLQLFWVP